MPMDQELIRLLKITGALAKIHLGPLLDGPRELILSGQLDRLFDDAQELDRSKRYADALAKYLEVFERSRKCPGWGGVRLSFVLSNISRMDYPPAKHALFELRQHRECQMLAGIYDWDHISEWVAINRYIADNDIIKFHEELKWLELDVYEICRDIRRLAMKNFVDAKLYSEYGRADIERNFAMLHMLVKQFRPGTALARGSEDTRKTLKESIIRQDVLAFEIAIALGEDDVANGMVRLFVELEPTSASFIALSERARHAGIVKWEKELATRAASCLSKDEYAKFERGNGGAS